MEFQAKELFAKHGVAVTLGKTVETAADARANKIKPILVPVPVKPAVGANGTPEPHDETTGSVVMPPLDPAHPAAHLPAESGGAYAASPSPNGVRPVSSS